MIGAGNLFQERNSECNSITLKSNARTCCNGHIKVNNRFRLLQRWSRFFKLDGCWQLHVATLSLSLLPTPAAQWARYSVLNTRLLGPPARCNNATRPLCFAAVSFFSFFLFFFSARSPRSLGRSPRNFATWSEMGAILNTRSKIWESSSKKIGPEKHAFWCDFGRLRTSIANISVTEQDIDNRKTALQITIAPASDGFW